MMNLFDRIVCNYSNLISLRQATQCKVCGIQLIANLEYPGPCHTGVHCVNCVSQCKQCIQNGKRSPVVQSLLSDVRFKCYYEGNGCKDLIHYDLLSQHEANCKYRNCFPISEKNYTPFIPNSVQRTESRFSKVFGAIQFENLNHSQSPLDYPLQEAIPTSFAAILPRISLP